MIFSSIDEFYQKADSYSYISRQEEIDCATKMKSGDLAAREKLIESYVPMVAVYIKHLKPHLQTFGLVLYCMQALEKAVNSFDFLQDSEPFSHRLSWWLRQAVTNYIVR